MVEFKKRHGEVAAIEGYSYWRYRSYACSESRRSPTKLLQEFVDSSVFNDLLLGPEDPALVEASRRSFESFFGSAPVSEEPPVHGPFLLSKLSPASFKSVTLVEAQGLMHSHLDSHGLLRGLSEIRDALKRLAVDAHLFWMAEDPRDPGVRYPVAPHDHFAEVIAVGRKTVRLLVVAAD